MTLWNSNFKPMLLDEKAKPFDSDKYIYELKYDGMRSLLFITPSSIKIINRNLNDVTNLFPELFEVTKIVKKKVIFDGEIICTKNEFPSFSKLQKRLHLKGKEKIKKSSLNNQAIFVCFDIIYEEKDLTNMSLLKRKRILDKYKNNEVFIKSFYTTSGKDLFNKIKKLKLEGIVAKLKTSKYFINTRSHEWIKIKNYIEQSFYIGGYSYKENSHVFSCFLGEFMKDKLMFVGKVFVSKKNNLFTILKKEKETNSPFENFNESNTKYINPRYKCLVKYIERTESNNLRQPFYVKGEL